MSISAVQHVVSRRSLIKNVDLVIISSGLLLLNYILLTINNSQEHSKSCLRIQNLIISTLNFEYLRKLIQINEIR